MDAQVSHWSPRKKIAHCCKHFISIWAMLLPPLYHHCVSFGRPIASFEWSLWRPLCLHSATTATVEPPWQWFCLHLPLYCCATTTVLVVRGTHKGRAAVVTQKQNFLSSSNHWASWSIFWSLEGGKKVAALCKGGFNKQYWRKHSKVWTHSNHGFAFYVKQSILNSYSTLCTTTNCYVRNKRSQVLSQRMSH